jgi:hypothetical protein
VLYTGGECLWQRPWRNGGRPHRVGVGDEELGRFGSEPTEPRRVRFRYARGLQQRLVRSPVRAPVVIQVLRQGGAASKLEGEMHGLH